MRIESFVVGLLVLGAVASPLFAQEEEKADTTATAGPDGPILVETGSAYTNALSALPAGYLARLTTRPLKRGHSLSSTLRRTVSVGVRVSDRWIVGAERAWIDTKFGLANVEVPIRQMGGIVHYIFPGHGVAALAGAGTVTYEPDGVASNTDFRWGLGIVAWNRLTDAIALKSIFRNDMSWFSAPGVDGGLQHQLTIGGTMVVSIP